jgi:hypothetical protein
MAYTLKGDDIYDTISQKSVTFKVTLIYSVMTQRGKYTVTGDRWFVSSLMWSLLGG